MNKVYNTVWNESTGTWVVTSELTRKGGRRPRQIKRTALAGLIAGLLMPSQPVMAAPSDNQTIGSGETNMYMHLSAGETVKNTTINSGGGQHVSSGGSATTTTINNSGVQHVSSGGNAITTTINSGGLQKVHSGGSVTDTIINDGGYQYVSGSDANAIINSGGASMSAVVVLPRMQLLTVVGDSRYSAAAVP